MNTLHPIFKDCCTDEPSRYDMSKPCIRGDYIYATDARICVRGPVPQGDIDTSDNHPDHSKLTQWDVSLYAATPIVLPDVPAITRKCQTCGGSGWYVLCEGCGGSGEVECPECRHINDCDQCDGRGYHPANADTPKAKHCCPCWGTGREEYPDAVRIDGCTAQTIAGRYLRLLQRHGCVVFPPVDPKGSCVRLIIPGTGIEGVLMLCGQYREDRMPPKGWCDHE